MCSKFHSRYIFFIAVTLKPSNYFPALPEILEDNTNEIRLSNNNRTKNRWKTFETLERQTIMLVCRAQGNPAPDIYWFKDKNYLRFYDANVITEDHGQVLLIRKVTREHAGNYTCVARNNIGEDKMNYQVDVWGESILYIYFCYPYFRLNNYLIT